MSVFKTYKLRKISLIITTLFSVIGLILLALQIGVFAKYVNAESELFKDIPEQQKDLKALKMAPLFYGSTYTMISLLSLSFLISSVGLFYIFSGKKNGYVFLRIITWISIVIIALSILILAVKIARDVTISLSEDDPYAFLYLKKPDYKFALTTLFLSIVNAIISGISRKEFSYIEKDDLFKKTGAVNKYEK